METESIKCKCQKKMKESDFKSHFQTCKDFRNTFKTFDIKFGEILKQFSEPSENLPIIRFLLYQYISVLDRKIKSLKVQISRPLDGGKKIINQDFQMKEKILQKRKNHVLQKSRKMMMEKMTIVYFMYVKYVNLQILII